MKHGNRTWWKGATQWAAAALALVAFAALLVPHAADTTGSAVLQAMAMHTHYLYAAAGIMLLIGCVDSILLYRRTRSTPGQRA